LLRTTIITKPATKRTNPTDRIIIESQRYAPVPLPASQSVACIEPQVKDLVRNGGMGRGSWVIFRLSLPGVGLLK